MDDDRANCRRRAATCLVFVLAGSALVATAAAGANHGRGASGDSRLRQVEPFATVLNWLDPVPASIFY